MVALRRDLDALGRDRDQRRLALLDGLIEGYEKRHAVGLLSPASLRLWELLKADRVELLAKLGRCAQCEENDQECALHAVACECRRPWGCSDRCVCFGVAVRGDFFRNVVCECWSFDDEDDS